MLISLAVLIPCFWQSRLQAGDLSSHLYNAWLGQLIGKGQAPGLGTAAQHTNVLFDLLLSALFGSVGSAVAQRIAVSVCVLVFFWGAFAFVAAASRRSWTLTPVVAMLAYGWVFHIGFFNFYLALGLCLFAMALAWEPQPQRLIAAAGLLGLAYVAHGLAVVWAIGALVYVWVWRKAPGRARRYLLGLGIVLIVLLRVAIAFSMPSRWYSSQLWHIIGADQLWVFGDKYKLAALALAAVWVWILVAWRQAFSGVFTPLFVLTAAAIVLIPNSILLPGYNHQLAYVAERMSLPLGVLICAMLANMPVRRVQTAALWAVAVVFFAFLYSDESALNDFEDQVDQVVMQFPSGQRVVLSVVDSGLEVNALTHMIDRACIGRCWSYANYEPASAQFRIRVTGKTSIVAATDEDSSRMQSGTYVVKPDDLPMFQILLDTAGRLVVRQPPVGQPLQITVWKGL
ncbi:MAG TPA: hypothetical protein VGF16_12415 [Bryobacteraceae bacterium]